MLVEQAKKFGDIIGITDFDFKYSSSWLESFKQRNDLCQKIKNRNLPESSLDPSLSNDNDEINGQNLTRDEYQDEENSMENMVAKNEVSKNEDTLYMDEIAELATESNEYNEPINESPSSYNVYSGPNKNGFDVGSEKKKRVVLDLDQKREIILYHDEFPSVSQQNIADYFSNKFQFKTKIARNTISTILSKRNLYFQADNTNNNNNKSRGHSHKSATEFSNFETFNTPEENDNNEYQEDYLQNENNNNYNLTIEEIIELARASEFTEPANSSNELNEEEDDEAAEAEAINDSDENPFIKIEPKSYTKSEALIGLENVQGLLIQSGLLDENDLEYISKLRSKLDLIN